MSAGDILLIKIRLSSEYHMSTANDLPLPFQTDPSLSLFSSFRLHSDDGSAIKKISRPINIRLNSMAVELDR